MNVVQVELAVGLALSLLASVGVGLTTAQHVPWLRQLRPALLGGLAAATLFTAHVGLVVLVTRHALFVSADQSILDWMVSHRAGVLDFVMVKISNLGSPVVMVTLAVLSAGLLLLAKRPRYALMLVVAGIGARLSLDMWKEAYERPRPSVATQLVMEPGFGLPSAHALNSIAAIGALAVVLTQLLRSAWLRLIVIVGAVTDVFLIGVSRLYIGVHWFTDVLTGWLLGGAWLALCLSIKYAVECWPSVTSKSMVALQQQGVAGTPSEHSREVAAPGESAA